MDCKYTVFNIEQKEVHVPSENYYARRGDSDTETINTLKYVDEFDSIEEAVSSVEYNLQFNKSGQYTILPVYKNV